MQGSKVLQYPKMYFLTPFGVRHCASELRSEISCGHGPLTKNMDARGAASSTNCRRILNRLLVNQNGGPAVRRARAMPHVLRHSVRRRSQSGGAAIGRTDEHVTLSPGPGRRPPRRSIQGGRGRRSRGGECQSEWMEPRSKFWDIAILLSLQTFFRIN